MASVGGATPSYLISWDILTSVFQSVFREELGGRVYLHQHCFCPSRLPYHSATRRQRTTQESGSEGDYWLPLVSHSSKTCALNVVTDKSVDTHMDLSVPSSPVLHLRRHCYRNSDSLPESSPDLISHVFMLALRSICSQIRSLNDVHIHVFMQLAQIIGYSQENRRI